MIEGKKHYNSQSHQLLIRKDAADNTFMDGTVLVTIPSDVNGDRKINLKNTFITAKKTLEKKIHKTQKPLIARCHTGESQQDL